MRGILVLLNKFSVIIAMHNYALGRINSQYTTDAPPVIELAVIKSNIFFGVMIAPIEHETEEQSRVILQGLYV